MMQEAQVWVTHTHTHTQFKVWAIHRHMLQCEVWVIHTHMLTHTVQGVGYAHIHMYIHS
jgi:hypothetical protein